MNLTVAPEDYRWLLLGLVVVLGSATIWAGTAYIMTNRLLRRIELESAERLVAYVRELDLYRNTSWGGTPSPAVDEAVTRAGEIDRLQKRRRFLLSCLGGNFLVAGSIGIGSYFYSSSRAIQFAELPSDIWKAREVNSTELASTFADTGAVNGAALIGSAMPQTGPVRPVGRPLQVRAFPNESRIRDSLRRQGMGPGESALSSSILAQAATDSLTVPMTTSHSSGTIVPPPSGPFSETLLLLTSHRDAIEAARSVVGRFVGAVHAGKSTSGLVTGLFRKDFLNFLDRSHPTAALKEIHVDKMSRDSAVLIVNLSFKWTAGADYQQSKDARFKVTTYRNEGAWLGFGQLDLLERFP